MSCKTCRELLVRAIFTIEEVVMCGGKIYIIVKALFEILTCTIYIGLRCSIHN